MKLQADTLRLSATDLASHLACRHLTTLDRAAAEGRLRAPHVSQAAAAVLRERGMAHEAAYLEHLEGRGLEVHRLEELADPLAALGRTLAALQSGVEVIAQATLVRGRWLGRADVLLRVDRPSRLGPWSYEVLDTKLARETKAGTLLQLCMYSDLLDEIQGLVPEHMYVVTPRSDFVPERYRVADFLAYYRLVRRRLEAAVAETEDPATYPEPIPHCDVCRWWSACERRRRDDDHLSLVAGASRLQRRELESRNVATLAALAGHPLPIVWIPSRGSPDGYTRIREQARIQLEGRVAGRPLHELLAVEPGRGLGLLPEPSPGDVFLDLEGDPYVGEGGLEYLFGWVVGDASGSGRYVDLWATDTAAERSAFETVMDVIMERWERWPDMHVYHYASYEPAAFKRLMGRHATREAAVDRLLRAERFVDLHAVVRQSLRASVEDYSIKRLEAHYGFTRAQSLRELAAAKQAIERALELDLVPEAAGESGRMVEAYNRDDCLSTRALRDWLEALRGELVATGTELSRPVPKTDQPNERISEREARARALAERLLAGVPPEDADRTDAHRALALFASMLDWHRREEKAPWWEFFRLVEMPDEELLEEPSAIAGMVFERLVPGTGRKPVHRFRFPRQETALRPRNKLRRVGDGRQLGMVVAVDQTARTIDLEASMAFGAEERISVFSHDVYGTAEQAGSLMRLGEWIADHGVDGAGPHRAARDLLLGLPPRIAGGAGGPLRRLDESSEDAARRLVMKLDHGALAIQGPPGSGKTWTGARMIVDLVRAGRRVGVCAVSHKVIRNLLLEVVKASPEGAAVRCLHKTEKSETDPDPIVETTSNDEALSAIQTRTAQVVGGTTWLWAREEFTGAVDVLFVDEAGQMSLANALAIAPSAKSVVLLGDPQQLEQPIQGSHPEGTAISALEHVLGGARTIDPDRGLFLEETWRLAPPICELTSELFYERRLRPHEGLEHQALLGTGTFDGAGLWFVPVGHDANQSACAEEVEIIAELVRSLSSGSASWRDRMEVERPVGLDDILVIAPYNAQVSDLAERLPHRARVGTVDRFQGQEAPVVIYSMTTSTPEDAPRGMEFLYSLNRFNVATSRARCACIVVGNPRLFEPECKSPRQMRLANAFCRFLEVATPVAWGPAAAPVVGSAADAPSA